jgi:melibiose permease/lactose/raffinose/galactose permease
VKVGDSAAESIGTQGQLILKVAMFAIPLVFIVAGYIIYLKKFKIDEKFYTRILAELKEKEQIEQ